MQQRGAVDTTAPRRGGVRPEHLRVGLFVGGLALAGLAAAAGGSVAGELTASGATTAVRLVLLVAGALVAGLGVVHPLTGASGKVHRRVAWTAGLLAAVAALAGYLHGDVGRTGTLVWVVAALAVPALLETRFASRATVPVAALPVTALVAVTFGSAHSGAAFAADVVFAVASALLLGVLAVLAVRPFDGPAVPGAAGRSADALGSDALGSDALGSGVPVGDPTGPASAPGWPGRLTAAGVVAAAVAVLAGVARILTAGPYSVADLISTAYGATAVAAVLAPAVALLVLVRSRTVDRRAAPVADGATRRDGVRRGPVAGAAGVLAAVGVAAASVAGLLPAPAPAAVPGQALLRTVALDGQNVPVVIAPMRPGPNLVQLGGSGYTATGAPAAQASGMAGMAGHDMTTHTGAATVEAGGDPVSFTSRPGAHGGWAVVDVPAGSTSVTVTMDGDSATVPVAVGDSAGTGSSAALAGRDGPECVSAVVGAVLAGGPGAGSVGSCPSQTLEPDQARALTDMVATMTEKGARTARVVSDASPRSVAAARLVRDEGARAGLAFPPDAVNDPNSALIVVSGWEQAVTVLDEAGRRATTTPTHLGGTFLAPWLLTGDVLRQTASAFLPLPFAPNEPDAQRFALALAATHPDTAPSASGYRAWARIAGVPDAPRASLYGAAAVNVPMSIEPAGSTGHHGGPDPAAWFPGGTVVPVSGPMEGSP